MCCNCIASHSMSCHCPVCVRLSHSIKDYYLLTYLLTHSLIFGEIKMINCFSVLETAQYTVYSVFSSSFYYIFIRDECVSKVK